MNAPAPARNLWPLGIVIAFATFIAGTAVLIVLAVSHRSELVTPDYYEQEIRHQQHMERVDRTQRLGAQASVSYDAGRQCLVIRIPLAHARAGATGRIHLYRASSSGLDRRLNLEPDSGGLQSIDFAGFPRGPWQVQVSWTAGGKEYYFDRRVVVGVAAKVGKAG